MSVRWSIATPAGRAGAIAAIAINTVDAASMDRVLASIGFDAVPVGQSRVGSIAGVDLGVVARWSPTRTDLMPHGGVAVVRAIAAVLENRCGASTALAPLEMYPEASSEIEAHALAALSVAPSARAVGVLLRSVARWAPLARSLDEADAVEPSPHGASLRRLLDPPLVVAIGPPNIGKSALLNALAGRQAAVVADQPGTTRDHVGALIDLDGLTVRYADTPGREASQTGGPDRDAQAASDAVGSQADLVLRCFDHAAEPVAGPPGVPSLLVQTRMDLANAAPDADVRTSARTGDGIAELAVRVRRALVSDEVLADPRPWAFWA